MPSKEYSLIPKDTRKKEEKEGSNDFAYKTMVYYGQERRDAIDKIREQFFHPLPSYNRMFNAALEHYLRSVESAGGVDRFLMPLKPGGNK